MFPQQKQLAAPNQEKAGKTDAGKTDAGKPDVGKPDVGKTDAGKPDLSTPDASKKVAGNRRPATRSLDVPLPPLLVGIAVVKQADRVGCRDELRGV